MSPFSKRKESPSPIAFRLPGVSRQQLDDLMDKWGENQSQVIIRCIERIWTMERGQARSSKPHRLPPGSATLPEEQKDTSTKIAGVQSVDGALELVLCPASIELRLVDRFKVIPLEAVQGIDYRDGRLQVMTQDGNTIEGHVEIKVGGYQLDCDLSSPGVFAEEDAHAFMQRFKEVKQLYMQYLQQLRRH